MPFLDNDGVTRLTTDYLDVFARKEDAILDPSGGLIRTDDGISVDSLIRESDGAISGSIVELTAKGHAEQASTTGKNLWSFGSTKNLSAEGYIANSSIQLAAGSYTISFDLSGTHTATQISVATYNDNSEVVSSDTIVLVDGNNSKTITLASNTSNLRVYINGSVSLSNIQLEAGSTATEYEPYTGGAPSPSPEFPQTIEVVTGHTVTGKTGRFVDLEVQGKNLLPIIAQTRNGITWTIVDGVLRFSGTVVTAYAYYYPQNAVGQSNKLSLNAGTYTISGAINSTSGVGINVQVMLDGTALLPWNSSSGSFTLGSASEVLIYYNIVGLTAGTSYSGTAELQLELGSTATEYEPYYHTTTPIPLPQRGWVAGLPDGTADTLRLDGAGKVEWTLPTSEMVFDGDASYMWAYNGGDGKRFYTTINGASQSDTSHHLALSNRLILTTDGGTYGANSDCFVITSASRLYISLQGTHPSIDNISDFVTFLQSNPIAILYPLATSITEDCGYVEDWPTDIPEGATITIPELDALNVKYFVDDSANALAKQWNARINSKVDSKVDRVESSIANVEQAIATMNHAVGDYFMLGDVLMRTTVAIASGEKITTSNATPATIQSQIDALWNSVSSVQSAGVNGVAYVQTGKLVFVRISTLQISGDNATSLGAIPLREYNMAFTLRDEVNGNIATFWLNNSHNNVRTFNAINFTDGNTYSGFFSYIAS